MGRSSNFRTLGIRQVRNASEDPEDPQQSVSHFPGFIVREILSECPSVDVLQLVYIASRELHFYLNSTSNRDTEGYPKTWWQMSAMLNVRKFTGVID
jgi:hypothetical protein